MPFSGLLESLLFPLDFPLKASVPHHFAQTVWRKCGVGWQDVELLMILYQLQSVSGLVV